MRRSRVIAAFAIVSGLSLVAHGCGSSEADPSAPSGDAGPDAPVTQSEPDAGRMVREDAGRPDAPDGGDAGGVVDSGPPPTHDDGIANGGETDVDCGGVTGAPPCALGRACATHDDCQSGACRYDGRCIASRSCAAHEGGDTCGPTGTDDCCKALPVPHPTAPFVLDKYVVTAGRFRQFVERTNGNLRGFIQSNRPAWWDPVWDAWLPAVLDDGTYDGKDGVYQQLGSGLYFDVQDGNNGCFIDGIGARTYWLPPAINQARFADFQTYGQADLDQKPLQCATFFMFAAFCAWDGGRMPSLAELDYAWNKGEPDNYLFPWGNTPRPGGWVDPWPTEADAIAYGTERCGPWGTGPCDHTVASYAYNAWTPAVPAGDKDRTIYIPQPGRFPNGNGPFGHADIAGLVFQFTATLSGATGDDPQTRQDMWSRSGSWQGHGIPFYHFGQGPLGWRSTSKYIAGGARCAR